MAANNGIRFTIVYRCFLLCSYYFSHPSHRSRNNSKNPRLKNSKVFIFENFSVYANTIEKRSKLNLGAELKIDELGDTPRIGRLNGELGHRLFCAKPREGEGERKEDKKRERKREGSLSKRGE